MDEDTEKHSTVAADGCGVKLVAGHHAALVLHEVFQQFEFLQREEHVLAADRHLMLVLRFHLLGFPIARFILSKNSMQVLLRENH